MAPAEALPPDLAVPRLRPVCDAERAVLPLEVPPARLVPFPLLVRLEAASWAAKTAAASAARAASAASILARGFSTTRWNTLFCIATCCTSRESIEVQGTAAPRLFPFSPKVDWSATEDAPSPTMVTSPVPSAAETAAATVAKLAAYSSLHASM